MYLHFLVEVLKVGTDALSYALVLTIFCEPIPHIGLPFSFLMPGKMLQSIDMLCFVATHGETSFFLNINRGGVDEEAVRRYGEGEDGGKTEVGM